MHCWLERAEWAARGGDLGTTFPWGEQLPDERPCWSGVVPLDHTCPVGLHVGADNPWGVNDLAGNVSEWTNSPGPDVGGEHAFFNVGGNWGDTDRAELGYKGRHLDVHSARFNNVGFRCVKSL